MEEPFVQHRAVQRITDYALVCLAKQCTTLIIPKMKLKHRCSEYVRPSLICFWHFTRT